ncbi:hypothetical protein pqer_cds_278 [Pandoravirus quercus]|uniref:Uncharacterized protein n=1 Tax=Pandoravirus quercus TaxID=2107709 RepID=A0A2U7U8E6_9VIRU|nr:hypothetical protein pqer_cds_278 [Pandoravirus quercus]AVK74700.1 hypothetical protein pqer_cds_278 [Pandoravirus quercus]
MHSNYGGGSWRAPPMSGGSKMAAIHQCLDAMRPLSPCPPFAPAMVAPTMAALDALPEPFCPQPAPPIAPLAPVVHAQPAAPPCELPPPQVVAATSTASCPTATTPAPETTARAVASERAAAALRSPALLALATAIVVVLVLIVVAPPFVLRKRGGVGSHDDPSCRWSKPRAQVDPVRLLVWGLLAGAAAFALPLAIDRVMTPPSPSSTKPAVRRPRKGA